jgi:23S rRNA pseudouridine2605 synthase
MVTVNGQTVRELGAKADPARDHIKVRGKLIRAEPLEYFAVNKPRGMLSAASDRSDRPLVTQLVKSKRRLYPVGRLDYQSEGLMILTNDGELARRVAHSGRIEKVYQVKVQGQPNEGQLDKLRNGIRLEGAQLKACRITIRKEGDNCWYTVVLQEGKNQQIRRMFERIGHRVMRLRRTVIGGVRLGKLRPGESRPLTPAELRTLRGDEE